MSQVIYTRDTINADTGELQTKEIFRKVVSSPEMFIRTYIEDIGALAKCSKAEQSTILCCLKFIDYGTNEFFLNKQRREEVSKCADLKLNTVHTAISRLQSKNILIKKSNSEYILNPKIFFYGKDIDRATVIKATMTYVIQPDK